MMMALVLSEGGKVKLEPKLDPKNDPKKSKIAFLFVCL